MRTASAPTDTDELKTNWRRIGDEAEVGKFLCFVSGSLLFCVFFYVIVLCCLVMLRVQFSVSENFCVFFPSLRRAVGYRLFL